MRILLLLERCLFKVKVQVPLWSWTFTRLSLIFGTVIVAVVATARITLVVVDQNLGITSIVSDVAAGGDIRRVKDRRRNEPVDVARRQERACLQCFDAVISGRLVLAPRGT